MFSGGFTPWKNNPKWAEQVRAERIAEEAARRKKQEEGGSGDIFARVVAALAGAGLIGVVFGSGPPIQ
jgi:hypothetical protein